MISPDFMFSGKGAITKTDYHQHFKRYRKFIIMNIKSLGVKVLFLKLNVKVLGVHSASPQAPLPTSEQEIANKDDDFCCKFHENFDLSMLFLFATCFIMSDLPRWGRCSHQFHPCSPCLHPCLCPSHLCPFCLCPPSCQINLPCQETRTLATFFLLFLPLWTLFPLSPITTCQETKTPVTFFSHSLTMDAPLFLSLTTFPLRVLPNRPYSPLSLVFVAASSLM